MKTNLLDDIGIFLLKQGFTIKSLTRTCFDLLARKGTLVLLVKILEDANAISQEYAEQMANIGNHIDAIPLIIAEKAGDRLEKNIVYSRYDIYTLNSETFKMSISGKFPFIKRTNAGLTANLIGERLKEMRENGGLSLQSLAHKIGVSRQMIQKYEAGVSEIRFQKALRIYDMFGANVFDKIDVFKAVQDFSFKPLSDISKRYAEMGFAALDTKKVPFDVIAKKDKEIILTEIGDKDTKQMTSLSQLLDADNLVIFKKKKPKGIPALTKKEFLEFEKSNELIKFLKEFH
jgi:putative transcriptional regulator